MTTVKAPTVNKLNKTQQNPTTPHARILTPAGQRPGAGTPMGELALRRGESAEVFLARMGVV